MLINNDNNNFKNHVEFVSYSGKYPSLCHGICVLRIDGDEYSFGWGADYPKFWNSGGRVSFDGKGNPVIRRGEWIIDLMRIPEDFRVYTCEIDDVFNDNVPRGCCGGCV